MQKRSPSIFIESDRKQEKRSCERFNYRMWDLLRVANRQSDAKYNYDWLLVGCKIVVQIWSKFVLLKNKQP